LLGGAAEGGNPAPGGARWGGRISLGMGCPASAPVRYSGQPSI